MVDHYWKRYPRIDGLYIRTAYETYQYYCYYPYYINYVFLLFFFFSISIGIFSGLKLEELTLLYIREKNQEVNPNRWTHNFDHNLGTYGIKFGEQGLRMDSTIVKFPPIFFFQNIC